MNETYVECLVKRKTGSLMKLLKILTIMLSAGFIFIGMIVIIALPIGVVLGIAAYFITMNADLEYEYLYVDRQLSVDKIMNRSRRKKLVAYDIDRMEILAPLKSWHLDGYKNRTPKVVDYSSGVERQPETRYAMYYDGKLKVLLEPSPELIKAIQTVAPRKVFKD